MAFIFLGVLFTLYIEFVLWALISVKNSRPKKSIRLARFEQKLAMIKQKRL